VIKSTGLIWRQGKGTYGIPYHKEKDHVAKRLRRAPVIGCFIMDSATSSMLIIYVTEFLKKYCKKLDYGIYECTI